MKLYPLSTDLIQPNEPLIPHLKKSINKAGVVPQEKDILVVTSKVVAVSEGRQVTLDKYEPSEEAKKWAETSQRDPRFCQAVIEEADEIIGDCPGAILTITKGGLIANAGIDQSNSPKGQMILWPVDPYFSAENLLGHLKEDWGIKELGMIISDSCCLPLRNGTVGFTLAYAGMEATIDERGEKDLFGNEIIMTQRNVADSVAVAANLLMGDTTEKIPFVLVRGVDAKFCEVTEGSIVMPKDECLFRDWYK